MKYKKADLNYIFVRSKDSKGNWGNLSLNEITDIQFVNWAEKRFNVEIKDDSTSKGTPWNQKQKVNFLNDMSKRLGNKPCVCMIKRDARND